MAQLMAPPPLKVPMTDKSGFVGQAWMGWYRDLLARVGGVGPVASNAETATTVANLNTLVTALQNNVAILLDADFGVGPVL